MNKIRNSCAVILLMLVFTTLTYAHGMNVKASVSDDGVLTITAQYHGGHPVEGAKVTVTTAEGEELFAGKTDSEGAASFTLACRADLKIAVRQGSHRGTATVTLDSIPESLPVCPENK